MQTKLEIKGKEYILTANRKVACVLANISTINEDMLDEAFYAMLKPEHNLSREEVSKLLDEAEKEYGVSQLIEFVGAITEEVFTEAETKYKKIEFLNRKNK
jgi:inorganic pyrophosphatase/exopolyphosphatase